MAEFNSDFQAENNSEILAKLQYLQNFAEGFSAADFVSNDPKFAAALGSMPFKLKEYLKVIAEIKASVEEKKEEANPLKQEEDRKKREEKIEKLAQEIFIISCASNKVLEQEKFGEFLDKFNLAKKLNEVGENGLSPVSATMISGKPQQEKDAALGMLLQSGAKITAQDLEASGQKKESEKENSRQREKEKNERKPTSKKLNFKEAEKAQEIADSEAIARQQQIVNAGIALELHQVGMLALREQMRQKARELAKEQEAKNVVETLQIKDAARQEEVKNEGGQIQEEKKNSANKISELEKILGIPLNEKTINQLLFSAVRNGQATFAQLLLNYGGSVNHKENGVTVLEAAIRGGNNSLIATFSAQASPETKSAALAANPNNEKLRDLISRSDLGEKMENKASLPDAPLNKKDSSKEGEIFSPPPVPKNSEKPSSEMSPRKDFSPQLLQNSGAVQGRSSSLK
jgi:hypothetical protein